MRKIRLELDALEVESFETAAVRDGEAGTVVAHGRQRVSEGGTCLEATCVEDCYWTVWETCRCLYTEENTCVLLSEEATCFC